MATVAVASTVANPRLSFGLNTDWLPVRRYKRCRLSRPCRYGRWGCRGVRKVGLEFSAAWAATPYCRTPMHPETDKSGPVNHAPQPVGGADAILSVDRSDQSTLPSCRNLVPTRWPPSGH